MLTSGPCISYSRCEALHNQSPFAEKVGASLASSKKSLDARWKQGFAATLGRDNCSDVVPIAMTPRHCKYPPM